MGMNCGMECIKYLIFVFNFIFAICGLGILTVGVILHYKIGDIASVMDVGFPPSLLILMMVVGAIIFIIAFFGCCGAIRDSHCMVVTFAVFLLTILVIQVAIAVFVYVHKVDANDLEKAYRKVFERQDENSKKIVDTVQDTLECCGVTSPSDFKNGNLPASCCKDRKDSSCYMTSTNLNHDGCVTKVRDWFSTYMNTVGYVVIGVAVIEIIGIIFSLCLANAIRNDERRGYRV